MVVAIVITRRHTMLRQNNDTRELSFSPPPSALVAPKQNKSKVDTERLPSPVTGGQFSGPYRVTYSEVAMTFACFQILLGCYILWRAFKASPRPAVAAVAAATSLGRSADFRTVYLERNKTIL